MEVTGRIEAISEKEDSYGVLLDGKWYNDFGKPSELQKGDMVKIEFITKGRWNNIDKITLLKEEKKEPAEQLQPQQKTLKAKSMSELSQDMEIAFDEADKILRKFVKEPEYIPIEQTTAIAITLFKRYAWMDKFEEK